MSAEQVIADTKAKHGLSGLHIFEDHGVFVVFGFRRNPSGYQASVENGCGATIMAALTNLDGRLTEGPIHRKDSPL